MSAANNSFYEAELCRVNEATAAIEAEVLAEMRSAAHIAGETMETCDICHETTRSDEEVIADSGKVAHVDCASNWFCRNFGRESLS